MGVLERVAGRRGVGKSMEVAVGGGVSEGLEGVIAGWVTGASVCGLRNKEGLYEIGDDAFVLVNSSERDQSLDAVKVTSVRMW